MLSRPSVDKAQSNINVSETKRASFAIGWLYTCTRSQTATKTLFNMLRLSIYMLTTF